MLAVCRTVRSTFTEDGSRTSKMVRLVLYSQLPLNLLWHSNLRTLHQIAAVVDSLESTKYRTEPRTSCAVPTEHVST